MPSESTGTSLPSGCACHVGEAIKVRTPSGTLEDGIVRWVGCLPIAPGDWLGIELQAPLGKHDGRSPDGQRYFECPPKHGIFVRPTAVVRCQANALDEGSVGPRDLEKGGRTSIGPRRRTLLNAANTAGTGGRRKILTETRERAQRLSVAWTHLREQQEAVQEQRLETCLARASRGEPDRRECQGDSGDEEMLLAEAAASVLMNQFEENVAVLDECVVKNRRREAARITEHLGDWQGSVEASEEDLDALEATVHRLGECIAMQQRFELALDDYRSKEVCLRVQVSSAKESLRLVEEESAGRITQLSSKFESVGLRCNDEGRALQREVELLEARRDIAAAEHAEVAVEEITLKARAEASEQLCQDGHSKARQELMAKRWTCGKLGRQESRAGVELQNLTNAFANQKQELLEDEQWTAEELEDCEVKIAAHHAIVESLLLDEVAARQGVEEQRSSRLAATCDSESRCRPSLSLWRSESPYAAAACSEAKDEAAALQQKLRCLEDETRRMSQRGRSTAWKEELEAASSEVRTIGQELRVREAFRTEGEEAQQAEIAAMGRRWGEALEASQALYATAMEKTKEARQNVRRLQEEMQASAGPGQAARFSTARFSMLSSAASDAEWFEAQGDSGEDESLNLLSGEATDLRVKLLIRDLKRFKNKHSTIFSELRKAQDRGHKEAQELSELMHEVNAFEMHAETARTEVALEKHACDNLSSKMLALRRSTLRGTRPFQARGSVHAGPASPGSVGGTSSMYESIQSPEPGPEPPGDEG
eukprot:TRINITY_DN45057_c0_g1_i1.p1 TRINITY_DN45057_c0_g1~~TRINITY_DN45057_c0_g1_i1.p1  ORF type:complete len:769 (+),score=142.62 TRINITY_DN45057_c0_g1_i1:227-2533(+)